MSETLVEMTKKRPISITEFLGPKGISIQITLPYGKDYVQMPIDEAKKFFRLALKRIEEFEKSIER